MIDPSRTAGPLSDGSSPEVDVALSGFRAALSRAMPGPPPRHRLRSGELRAGEPLPYDLYDAAGRRLLPEGIVPPDAGMLERLIERGAYCDVDRHAAAATPGAIAPTMMLPRVARVRPWQRLYTLRDRLDSALHEIGLGSRGTAGALDTVRGVAAELQRLCALDPDALLAAPLLLEGGRYGTRHAIAAAVVLEFMLVHRGTPGAERRTAMLAALTMNVGMLALQDTLYAHAGPLSAEQRAGVLGHPQAGVALLGAAGVDDPVWLAIVAQHHEHLDGTGYPARLAGAAIRPQAQALMVADRWCAMVAPRAYRPGAPPDQALRMLLGRLAGEADPALAQRLDEVVGPLPPGTPVQLASGERGIVFRRTPDPAAPRVLVLRSASGERLTEAVARTTNDPKQRIVATIDRVRLDAAIDPVRVWEAAEVLEPDAPAQPAS